MYVLPNAEPAAGQVVGRGEGHQPRIPQVTPHLVALAVVLQQTAVLVEQDLLLEFPSGVTDPAP